jgi:hypothetical protein
MQPTRAYGFQLPIANQRRANTLKNYQKVLALIAGQQYPKKVALPI